MADDDEPLAKDDFVRVWLAYCRAQLAEAVARGRETNRDRERPAA